ncbi:hypothetical protein G7Y89_g7209 [Cudoniella acicularis]|uniref:B30.2/SPRY domain-containing protein n=1 Tax=Cudoniella acicularis TaxID=354080 RepID=A0A8H4RJ05_9HELO|nr:hypothetical protein G7Y89_g7209 [Cudoniella acicularis]
MDLKDSDGLTPFLIAVSKGKEDSVKALLDANDKIDLHQGSKDGETPLWLAIDAGSVEVVRVLLDSPRMDINSPREDAELLIRHAIRPRGNSSPAALVSLLLDKNPKINCRSDILFSAAAEIDHVRLNTLLLEGGADQTRTDIHGWTLTQVVAASHPPFPATPTPATTLKLPFEPPTAWNPEDKSNGLEIGARGGDKQLVVRCVADGTDSSWRGKILSLFGSRARRRPGAVRADHPIPPVGHFLFEILVIDNGGDGQISIGFGHKMAPLGGMPGLDASSWGYSGVGALLNMLDDKEISQQATSFTKDDKIGCFVNPAAGTAFFTKNGKKLDVGFKGITGRLYPMIGMRGRGAEVLAKFTWISPQTELAGKTFIENEVERVAFSALYSQR